LAVASRGPGSSEGALPNSLGSPASRFLLSNLHQLVPVGTEYVRLHPGHDEHHSGETIECLREAHEHLFRPDGLQLLVALLCGCRWREHSDLVAATADSSDE